MSPELAQEIRDLSHDRLMKLAQKIQRPRETFLLQAQHLKGLKYDLDEFVARWLDGETTVSIFSSGKLVEQVPVTCIGSTSRRSAA